MNSRVLILACLIGFVTVDVYGQPRAWTDRSGQHSIRAELAETDGTTVVLLRNDGKRVAIRLDRLSEADQQYVQGLHSTKPEESSADPPPVAEPDRGTETGKGKDDGTLREVVATGHGMTEEEARRNALQSAVEQTIGVLVDAATVVENDALLFDKILTFSNGYVDTYNIVSVKKVHGLIQVRLIAKVKCQPLANRLRSLSIFMSQEIDGASLAAAASTKGQSHRDVTSMLTELFDGFPANCLKITTGVLRPGMVDSRGRAPLTVPITVTADPVRYQAFDASLRKLLSKLAVQQKTHSLVRIDLRENTEETKKYQPTTLKPYAEPDGIPFYVFTGFTGFSHEGLSMMHFGRPGDDPSQTFGIALYNTDRDTPRRTTWTLFELNNEHLPFFQSRYYRTGRRNLPLNLLVTLLDAAEEPLEEERFMPIIEDSCIVEHPGTRQRPSVVLAGVRHDPERHTAGLGVTLSLINPGLTEAPNANEVIRRGLEGSSSDARELVPVFPIAPQFFYEVSSAPAHSPEVRLAVTFKDMELGTIERVQRVACELSLDEQP